VRVRGPRNHSYKTIVEIVSRCPSANSCSSASSERRGPVSASPDSTGGAQRAQFRVDVAGVARRRRVAQTPQGGEGVALLAVAQTIAAGGILGDRFAHDVALRHAQARGRAPDLGNGVVAERKRHSCHNKTILPYNTPRGD
jgi:hypothetical protein